MTVSTICAIVMWVIVVLALFSGIITGFRGADSSTIMVWLLLAFMWILSMYLSTRLGIEEMKDNQIEILQQIDLLEKQLVEE